MYEARHVQSESSVAPSVVAGAEIAPGSLPEQPQLSCSYIDREEFPSAIPAYYVRLFISRSAQTKNLGTRCQGAGRLAKNIVNSFS